jgi:hypothetical protein
MPRLQTIISLPYLLKLESGLYSTGEGGHDLEIHQPSRAVGNKPADASVAQASDQAESDIWEEINPNVYLTAVSLTSDQPDTEDLDERRLLKSRQADLLLSLTNRMLRCYRSIAQNTEITELSRAGASPFRFRLVSVAADSLTWVSELTYKGSLPKALAQKTPRISNRVRLLLASGLEPEVADLFLLDAERALHEGRFREAVLFCWSTIDSTFNRKYDDLVDLELAGEWAEAREFFKGVDFGLKKKMSAALYLVGGRSLFRESGDLWQQLSISYNKRNGIIHGGENATEDDARRAINVARRIVGIMNEL